MKPKVKHRNATHGHSSSRTYFIWQGMKDRCLNPRNTGFANYGGRGITVCARWLESFEHFLADMGEAPNGLSIERQNNDGNYEPSNCRWATRAEQNNNSRNCRRITWNGKTQTVTEWAAELGCKPVRISARISGGMTEEQAISTPLDDPWLARARRQRRMLITYRGVTKTTAEWARIAGVNRTTIQYRLAAGWTAEDIMALAPNRTNRAHPGAKKT